MGKLKTLKMMMLSIGTVGLLSGCVSNSIDQTLDVSGQSTSKIPKISGVKLGNSIADTSSNAYAGNNLQGNEIPTAVQSIEQNLNQTPEGTPQFSTFGEVLNDGRERSSKAEVEAAMQALQQKSEDLNGSVGVVNPSDTAKRARNLQGSVENHTDQVLREIEQSGK